MTILEWAAVGAILLAALVFCFRLMRRGLRTLDDDRATFLERIRAGERQLAEERKRISADEHMRVLRAAVDDILRLADRPAGHSLEAHGRSLILHTPGGDWRMELVMRERVLRRTHQVIHGRSRWILEGPGQCEQHEDPASLMASLHAHLRAARPGGDEPEPEPAHLARRIRARAEPSPARGHTRATGGRLSRSCAGGRGRF